MKLFALTLLAPAMVFFFQSEGRAAEIASLPQDVTYTRDLKVHYDSFPALVDKAFEHAAFAVLKGNGKNISINSLDQMDRVYMPKYGEAFKDSRIAFAKSGVELKGSAKLNEIYHAGSGYLVHFKHPAQGIVAVFFKGFSEDRIAKVRDDIVSLLGNKTAAVVVKPAAGKLQLLQLLQTKAFAEGGGTCDGFLGSESGKNLSMSSFEKLWKCSGGFANGVWDSTGGAVVSLAKGAYNTVIHPIETFNRAADELEKIKAVLSDLEGAFGDLKAQFQQLPEEARVKIYCEVVGSIGTSGLIAYVTAGSGSPLVARALAQATAKVSKMLPKGPSAKAADLAGKMADKAKAQVDLMARADKNSKLYLKYKDIAAYKKERDALMNKWEFEDPYKNVQSLFPVRDAVGKSKSVDLHGARADLDDYGRIMGLNKDHAIKELAESLMGEDPKLAKELLGFVEDRKNARFLNGKIRSSQQKIKDLTGEGNYGNYAEWARDKNPLARPKSDGEVGAAAVSEVDALPADLSPKAKAALASMFVAGPCTTAASVASQVSNGPKANSNSRSSSDQKVKQGAN